MSAEDPRYKPTYQLSEAAHYLRIPKATLRSWLVGAHYPTSAGRRQFKPLISIADREHLLLSFVNLVEAHVLGAIRTQHGVSLQKVRKALNYLDRELPSPHPLAVRDFETNGADLFVNSYTKLVNLTQQGQLAMREMLQQFLRRIERDEKGLAISLYPFTRLHVSENVRAIVINPTIQFGRPVIAGTGIPTAIVAERYKAGESVAELAKDYGRTPVEVEVAIRCELPLKAA